MTDLIWLGKTLLLYALLCAAGLAAVVLCHRLAAWWRGRHARPAGPAADDDDWRHYHIVAVGRAPSLINDPHGPQRCPCAACRAKRVAAR